MGESGRTVGVRHKEHTEGKHSSGVWDHIQATGHAFSMDNVKVLEREPNIGYANTERPFTFICVNQLRTKPYSLFLF